MVGKKSRSVYRKKRKKIFSGRRKQKEESEETAPDVDEIAASTPSTSRDENQLSDSDSKETVGSSRKKMKYAASFRQLWWRVYLQYRGKRGI